MWLVFWTFLTPPPPHVDHFTKLGLCTYVDISRTPLPPWLSTWFKDPPIREFHASVIRNAYFIIVILT